MIGWLSSIFGSGSLIKDISGIIDEFHLSPEEKERFKLETKSLIQKHDSAIEETIRQELKSKEKVLIAELQQGDNFTKRARPTVVYAGLGFIIFNYCIIPTIQLVFGLTVAPFILPTAFWAGWSGIVATWSIGRTMEKRGVKNKSVSMITGSLLDK